MPDLSLDPSALTVTQLPPPSSVSGKANGASLPNVAKAGKAANAAPRVDLEPLYTGLKIAIGEHWAEYKEAISLFLLGSLTQNEFCLRTDHFLTGDPFTEHQHNQLVAGIFSNCGRDPPEPGVAPWVSANDKPVVQSKPTAGDAVEQRLKSEVMQLPARDRRRLKEVAEPDTIDSIPQEILDYQQARKFRSTDYVPPSIGGKTNWDLEIKKRFAQPLAAESGEFPDAEVIQARMVPICYSESLSNGASAACAGFMATATEQFMKEILSNIFCRTKSNMSGGSINSVQTHRFKAQLQLEEDQYSRHEIMKVAGTGLLPVEAKEASIKSSLAMHDLKMAMDVGDILVGQFPLIASRIDLSYAEDEYEEYQTRRAENARKIGEQQKPQHDRAQWLKTHNQDVVMKDVDDMPASSITNGVNGHNDSWDDEDEDNDWGWDGGNADSREQLNASLDACLAMDT